MKKYIFIILSLAFVSAQGFNTNIDSYKSNVIIRPLGEKIEVLTYVEIFNNNLQFLKKDSEFESSYSLIISLISPNGNKIDEKSFSDKIVVNNFTQTVSRSKPTSIVASFVIPYQEFTVNFSLKDMDTKLNGKKQKKFLKKNLPSGKYFDIFDPIFFKKKIGDWKFDLDNYPIDSKKIEIVDKSLQFYQYFTKEKGDYSLKISLISNKKTVWDKMFEDSSNLNYDFKLIKIPIEEIEASDLRIKVELSQSQNVASKSFPVNVVDNFLMLTSAKNISSALEQMRYILTSEERRELRTLKNSEKINFFKKSWAKRDPDVTTKENELMIEYYSRVSFAEQYFSRANSGGWRTDMGMIYILFGRPDDITRSMNPQQSYNFETWYYYQINEKFTFIDDYGYGDYRLRTPFVY